MPLEERSKIYQDESLFTFKVDDYMLPSLLIKLLKSMKKNEICEFETTKIDKLHTNFANEYFD